MLVPGSIGIYTTKLVCLLIPICRGLFLARVHAVLRVFVGKRGRAAVDGPRKQRRSVSLTENVASAPDIAPGYRWQQQPPREHSSLVVHFLHGPLPQFPCNASKGQRQLQLREVAPRLSNSGEYCVLEWGVDQLTGRTRSGRAACAWVGKDKRARERTGWSE